MLYKSLDSQIFLEKILDEILKELKKVKQPNIDFNKIIKDDSN